MASLDLLDQVEAFKGMNDDQLTAIQPHVHEMTFQRGDKLFTEGDPATEVWFVMEGEVDLRFEMPDGRPTTDETTISKVQAKDFVAKTLGWSCFVPPHKMRLSAYCISRSCKVIKIARENLIRIFDKDHQAGYRFMSYLVKVVGYRFQQFQDEVAKHRGEYMMSGW